MTEEMMSVTGNKNATHWNLEDGYNNTGPIDPDTYPFRVVIVTIEFRPVSCTCAV